jgi:hypothetical protein
MTDDYLIEHFYIEEYFFKCQVKVSYRLVIDIGYSYRLLVFLHFLQVKKEKN